MAALAALAAACGDDSAGGGPSPGATTSTTTEAAPVTTTAPPPTSTTASPTTPTVFTTTPPGAVAGPVRLTSAAAVTTAGIGPLTFGMDVPAAEQALGSRLLPDPAYAAASDCIVVKPEAGTDGVWFTIWRRTVERVDIHSPATVTTRSGAGVGTTEAQLTALFGDQLSTTASSPAGRTLTFTPQDTANAAFRVVFEVDPAGTVTSFRSGRVGAVETSLPCTGEQ